MVEEKNLILNKQRVMQIIKRIAYQIYEDNYQEKELFIAGLHDKGYVFGQLLLNELKTICNLDIRLVRVDLNKTSIVQPEVVLDIDISEVTGKSIVVTDDVLNTGRALMYSLMPFLNIPVAKIRTAVIVDREHRKFPISADYTGYSLATTLREHIEVNFGEAEFGVYLH